MGRLMKKVLRTEPCSNCGHSATVARGDHRFDDMGLPVILGNIEIIKCADCGTAEPMIPHMNELMDTLALAVICQPCKLGGDEVRFLRTYVGKSSKDFAALLHLDKTTLSKYENDGRDIGKQTDKLIRLLALNLSPELSKNLDQFLAMMADIDDDPCKEQSDIRIDPATLRYQYA
jgi:DNA-binding transcriptional regulator YiaG